MHMHYEHNDNNIKYVLMNVLQTKQVVLRISVVLRTKHIMLSVAVKVHLCYLLSQKFNYLLQHLLQGTTPHTGHCTCKTHTD